jgi:hypothetical protein
MLMVLSLDGLGQILARDKMYRGMQQLYADLLAVAA